MAKQQSKSAEKKRQLKTKLPFSLSNKKSAKKTKPKTLLEFNLLINEKVWLRFALERSKPKKKRLSKKQQAIQKRNQNIITALFITAGLAGLVYFSQNLVQPITPPEVFSPPTPIVVEPIIADTVYLSHSVPVYLSIPDVDINTEITKVGLNPDRTLEVPASSSIVGWYQHSPSPGQLGPSIIVGHVLDNYGIGIFWRLSELTAGQKIHITRADGQIVNFEVIEVLSFDQNNFPTERVYGNIDHAGLRLITCGGTFDTSTGRYSHNTVVYARMVE